MHLFRPGCTYPVAPRREPNLTYRISRAPYPALRRVVLGAVVRSDNLARAMPLAGLQGSGEDAEPVLENRDILALLDGAR